MTLVSYREDANVAIVLIDNPPVNATSAAVRTALLSAIQRADAAACRQGIIFCAGRTFVAGGDVAEFDKPPCEPHLPDVYNTIESSPVVWLAALHGTVLGGGFELAMACDFRICLPATRFGLPEVNLGLIPGAGGTQRLPRLVGVEMAIDMATSGRMVTAAELLDAHGLDQITRATQSGDDELLASAHAFLASQPTAPVALSKRDIAPVPDEYFAVKRQHIVDKAKGATAPVHNLDAIEWATQLPYKKGQARERKLHLELRQSAQSIALRHVFFAERAVAKPAAIVNLEPLPCEHITVVGGGLMGAGIASACLVAGLTVVLIEQDAAAADSACERVFALLDGALNRGKITARQCDDYRGRFNVTDDYAAAAPTDLAIEAVFEDLAVKQQVFAALAEHMREDAILATNTSYLDPLDIGHGIVNAKRIVGLHFFSPAHIMKLMEIVRTPHTDGAVLASAFALAKRLRKVGVLCGICDGFIGNRMLTAYRRQADYLLADGALPAQIDQAMRAYGLPMGPYELQDLTGLQIAWANRKRQAATRNPAERYVDLGDQLCEQQRFGQRSGSGWYRYIEGSRSPQPDVCVQQMIEAWSADHGITRQVFTDDDIQQRLLAVLANEGARIVEEGIAERELDVDMVKIHGYGFPRWRGGPMHAAEAMGNAAVQKVLEVVAAQSSGSWTIAGRYRDT